MQLNVPNGLLLVDGWMDGWMDRETTTDYRVPTYIYNTHNTKIHNVMMKDTILLWLSLLFHLFG